MKLNDGFLAVHDTYLHTNTRAECYGNNPLQGLKVDDPSVQILVVLPQKWDRIRHCERQQVMANFSVRTNILSAKSQKVFRMKLNKHGSMFMDIRNRVRLGNLQEG